MKLIPLILIGLGALFSCTSTQEQHNEAQESTPSNPTYEPSWESLAQHNAEPEWLKDAKLGIYFHWGVYSVPAFDSEWYPRNMFVKDHKAREYHEKTYGKPATFGYHDFVSSFTAESFDPEDWAELFAQAGARFAGPVAEHHDGFSMWASKVTPWNVQDKGPKRDILGQLFKALEKRNMKTIATFHHARNLQRYADTWEEEAQQDMPEPRKFFSSHYPYHPDLPTASEDAELRLLYGNMPEEEWLEKIWLGKLKEVVDNYQPDIVWFDSWLDQIPDSYRQKFVAHYLNAAAQWDKEVVIVRKQEDLPLEVSINDHEKSREPKALKELWMTDDTYSTGSWCYTQDLELKPTQKVLHSLIDAVSKNGVLLLNISPKADGTIPEDQRKGLLELGAWLKKNGEAIYNTRPWINAAEGPTVEPEGGFSDHQKFLKLEYSSKDIRYTRSKDGKTVYVLTLGIPQAGEVILLKTFAHENVSVQRVSTLSGEAIPWEMTDEGLQITAKNTGNEMAEAFKVEVE